jgi:hypothetical protein
MPDLAKFWQPPTRLLRFGPWSSIINNHQGWIKVVDGREAPAARRRFRFRAARDEIDSGRGAAALSAWHASGIGLGRVVALHRRSSTSYEIR